MPTYATTVKYALRCLTGANVVSDIDAGIQALADDIDGKIATYSQGLLSARPTSTPGTPGIVGRMYGTTDLGLRFTDTGTGWAPDGIPVGGGFDWFGTADPSPELMICDGRAISRTTYAGLFLQIGTTFGVGNGTTTFNIPSTADRVLVGVSGTIARGATGGEKTHTQTVTELASHAHLFGPDNNYKPAVNQAGAEVQGGIGTGPIVHGATIQPTGDSTPFNVMQPYLAAYKVIRVL